MQTKMEVMRFRIHQLNVEVHPDSQSSAQAAADAASQAICRLSQVQDLISVVFATGASQREMLDALVSREDVPWNKIIGFHLDEYVGIDENHRASFRRYLRENLTTRVPLCEFYEIDGNARNLESFCASYAKKLRESNPQLCLLGIGENGHLAFNDPGEAKFQDPLDMKVVLLDSACHRQQVAEGWFRRSDEVPSQALTLTIPTIMRIPKLILTVPGERKAHIVKRALQDPISEACPATILRTHPDATLFLDAASAAELNLRDAVLSAR
jgi:glucosamine-6-phosphate deaminase